MIASADEHFGLWTVLTNINWKEETWLIVLLTIHLLTTISIFTIIKSHTNIQIILFILLLGAAYFSEQINNYAAINWRYYSKQQYFDSHGLFISVVFSIPILLNCMLLIGLWLYNSSELITKIKKLQQKKKMQREESQKKYE